MSNSTEKFKVSKTFIEDWGKLWVVVEFKNGTKWIPSFEDLYRIIVPICECEDEKYPRPENSGKFYVLNFLADTIKHYPPYELLAEKYKIPVRRMGEVVNSNGAKLSNLSKIRVNCN